VKSATVLCDAVREAWSSIPAPPPEDLAYMEWGWGEPAARAFTGVAPMDVDIRSVGFHAATPLQDIPPRAAAAYLGTFLLALLRSVERQKTVGIFSDVVTRAHTLACLMNPNFWERVIRPVLPLQCRETLRDVVLFLSSERQALALTDQEADGMESLAAEGLAAGPPP
jgi:hypothetical protein